jgi:hypothetical protein
MKNKGRNPKAKAKFASDPFDWPLSNSSPGEIYIQFPMDWKWAEAEAWLSEHGIRSTHKVSSMPYRWGRWRPLKCCKYPVDVFVFAKTKP